MARKYDIAERIANANQKPTVTIDADHEFKINNSKSAAIMLQAMVEETQNKESMEFLDQVVTLALGKDAYEYIESLELTLPAYTEIVMAIMASMQDVSIEELEEETKKEKK